LVRLTKKLHEDGIKNPNVFQFFEFMGTAPLEDAVLYRNGLVTRSEEENEKEVTSNNTSHHGSLD
jgi:hypothetical protein